MACLGDEEDFIVRRRTSVAAWEDRLAQASRRLGLWRRLEGPRWAGDCEERRFSNLLADWRFSESVGSTSEDESKIAAKDDELCRGA